MNTVVVMNVSGTRLMLMGRTVKPLRETTEDQEFQFVEPKEASAFADAINTRNGQSMKAIYAGVEVVEVVDIDLIQSLKAKTVRELKAMCKELGITGYSALNEAELIGLILEKQDEEK